MSVANQKVVHVHKPKYQRDFLQIGIDEWQEASKSLNYSEFKLYLYLAGNADGYSLELSQKAVENAIGIKKTAYHDAVKKLKELGFLKEASSNILDFYIRAVRISEQGEAGMEIQF
jgi:DNA-binding MarR family transcriptional regulator